MKWSGSACRPKNQDSRCGSENDTTKSRFQKELSLALRATAVGALALALMLDVFPVVIEALFQEVGTVVDVVALEAGFLGIL